MESNRYNKIHFATFEYEDVATLSIEPKPDAVLRVYMVYKPLIFPQVIKEQELKSFSRHGFTVVEWGGTEL